MNLGESFKTLLTSFGVPTIAITSIFIAVNLFKVFQPITMFSSVVFEQKLFSKEKMFIVKLCKYIFYTLAWMIIFASLGETLREKLNWEYNRNWSVTAEVLIGIIIIVLVSLNEIRNPERKMYKIKSNGFFKIFMVCLYLLLLFIFYIQVYLLLAFPQFKEFDMLTAAILMFFITCAAIPVISGIIFKSINLTNEKHVFIEDEDKNEWFILHPISKEVILLGDKFDPRLCTKTMVVKLEDLYNKPIKVYKN
ncbi:hypothetical protein MOC27_14225 [Bacillus inaquosorum]|uniref:hypothetical protein n=1 Tax=Bacillus inaquosorum TaxID=483913 RepID=UPI0022811E01|nr:hypothetical protein [Bacillus inaquosorum]MCY7940494.1 hypothetical protein [Bacillus inaquosorum]MCY8247745.1 hypothetical protein [Bacillus inaquosorum]MCY8250874.1 hypothetical protein [Bacillus inaquosorum]MCY8708577.1 hypothetical protein [Bacillus inaquosorum]MCY9381705.1 hypothetical protein [Bacillus inaquosorum]